MDDDRGTGRTTRQMLAAPHGAVFVWCNNGSAGYARDLAQKHGRDDLKVVTPQWLEDGKWQGHRLTGLIVDHAARLSAAQMAALHYASARVRVPSEAQWTG